MMLTTWLLLSGHRIRSLSGKGRLRGCHEFTPKPAPLNWIFAVMITILWENTLWMRYRAHSNLILKLNTSAWDYSCLGCPSLMQIIKKADDKQKGTWTAEINQEICVLFCRSVFFCPFGIWIFTELSPFVPLNDCQGKGSIVLSWSLKCGTSKLWDADLVKVTPEGAEDRINGKVLVCLPAGFFLLYHLRGTFHRVQWAPFTNSTSIYWEFIAFACEELFYILGTADRTMNSIKILPPWYEQTDNETCKPLKFLLVLLSTFYP